MIASAAFDSEATRALPYREIRAIYDSQTIRVYQAYAYEIAILAVENGRFISPPFKMNRMTWIKPSFLWMMYRCGWGQKESDQQRVLALDISRSGFDWALQNASLSHRSSTPSPQEMCLEPERRPVRVQWDPERGLKSQRLAYRSIQVGLSGKAVQLYVQEWIARITDITEEVQLLHALIKSGNIAEASKRLPKERPYPVDETIKARLGMV